MDLAPAMPPAQDTYPVLVSSTTDLPPDLTASSSDVSADSSPAQLSFLPPVSPEFLISSHLSRSFNFVGQAFRSARIAGVINQTLYSSALSLRWAVDDSWKIKAQSAEVRVDLVNANPQAARIENNAWSAAWAEQCMPGAQREMSAGRKYRLSLGDRTLGYVANEARAYLLAQQLKRLVRQASFVPDAIAPHPAAADAEIADTTYAVGTVQQKLLTIDDSMAEALGYSKEWAAVAWANNLRLALDAEPLSVGDTHMAFQRLERSKIAMSGEASWYGPYFHGRATANGETYNQNELTVAHKSLPFGTQLKVRNLTNDKTVVVRVNDRGPYVGDRILDLSRAAADCLGSNEAGVIPVEATVLKTARRLALGAK